MAQPEPTQGRLTPRGEGALLVLGNRPLSCSYHGHLTPKGAQV